MRTVKRSVAASGWQEINSQAQRIFNSENILYYTAMIGTHHHTFVQSHRTYSTRSESPCKLWALGDYDVSV